MTGVSPHLFQPGDYGRWDKMGVYGRAPSGGLANMSAHEIVENADGTLTIRPSILLGGQLPWHGYLTDGVWIEC